MRHKVDLDKLDFTSWKKADVGAAQVAVYVMAGGGLIGRFAAEQPADFYVYDRVSRRPYPKRELYRAVAVLARMAQANGLDPRNMPSMPRLHSLTVF